VTTPITPHGAQLPPATRLARLLRNTLDAARASGMDQRVSLSGGAQVIARVRGGVAWMTVKRFKRPVGAVELETFLRDAGVPDDADRFPLEGQYEWDGWHYVAFRWKDRADAD